jgi:hypothetical protein
MQSNPLQQPESSSLHSAEENGKDSLLALLHSSSSTQKSWSENCSLEMLLNNA